MLIGVVTQVMGFLLLGLMPASIGLCAGTSFSTTFSQVFIGTMWDTLLVEAMRHEAEGRKGKLQVSCWIGLRAGSLAGDLIGGALLEHMSDQSVFVLTGLLKLLLLPMVLGLSEPLVSAYASNRGRGRGRGRTKAGSEIGALPHWKVAMANCASASNDELSSRARFQKFLSTGSVLRCCTVSSIMA